MRWKNVLKSRASLKKQKDFKFVISTENIEKAQVKEVFYRDDNGVCGGLECLEEN